MSMNTGSRSLLILKAILFVYPVLLLTVAGGVGGSFILLLLLSIYMLVRQGKAGLRGAMDRDTVLLVVAMAATFVSVGLQELYQMQADASALDSPSRFLVVPIIFMALRNTGDKAIGIMQYGLPIGALLTGGLILASGQHLYARNYFLMHIHLGDLALLLLGCGVAGMLAFFASSTVHMRLKAAVSDLRATSHTYNSSLGARIQLWRTAVEAFRENPLVGVGPDGYRALIEKKEASGAMIVPVALAGLGEIHSYYFATLARYGLAGMAGLAMLFFVPLRLFYKRR